MARRSYHLSLARQLILDQFQVITGQLLAAAMGEEKLSLFQRADLKLKAKRLIDVAGGTGREQIEFYEKATGKKILPTKEEKKEEKERDVLKNLRRRILKADRLVAGTDYRYLENPVGSGKYVIYRGTNFLGTCDSLGEVIRKLQTYLKFTNERKTA